MVLKNDVTSLLRELPELIHIIKLALLKNSLNLTLRFIIICRE